MTFLFSLWQKFDYEVQKWQNFVGIKNYFTIINPFFLNDFYFFRKFSDFFREYRRLLSYLHFPKNAIQVINNLNISCDEAADSCKYLVNTQIHQGMDLVLQWIPSYGGIQIHLSAKPASRMQPPDGYLKEQTLGDTEWTAITELPRGCAYSIFQIGHWKWLPERASAQN